MPKDYSLTGETGRAAVAQGLANPSWYRPKVDPATIRALMEKSDAIALRDTGVWIGAMILSAGIAIALWPSLWSAPFWAALSEITDEENRLTLGRKSTVNDHNIEGSPGTEIIPELYADTDYVIDNKKRLDCFMGTDLDMLLENVGARNVCLMGINTNTCVLNTAFTAHNKNYRTVVLSDCVASMYGDDLHEFGLQNVMRCLGWVVTNDQFRDKIGEGRRLND